MEFLKRDNDCFLRVCTKRCVWVALFLFTGILFSCDHEEEECLGSGVPNMRWTFSNEAKKDTVFSIHALFDSTIVVADTSMGSISTLEVPLPIGETQLEYIIKFYSGAEDTVFISYQKEEYINNLECGVQVSFFLDTYNSTSTTNCITAFEILDASINYIYSNHVEINY
jgi:hypothetical protein